jgi:hypothetical protein
VEAALDDLLAECERERLELEVKYGMEYEDFCRKLEAGDLGDEFGYELELDAMRWGGPGR